MRNLFNVIWFVLYVVVYMICKEVETIGVLETYILGVFVGVGLMLNLLYFGE